MDEAAATNTTDKAPDIRPSAHYNVFNRNPVATFILDPATLRVIEANEMAVAQYQFTHEEFREMSWPDLFWLEDRETYMEKRSAGGLCVPQEKVWRHLKKDTTILSLEITECPLETPDGSYLIAMAFDVTGELRAKEEKSQLQKQLFEAKRMETAGKLAGAIAHDFNNILTSLVGYGSLLQMELPEQSPSRTYVEQILSSSEKAAQLTQSLLAFSRQQSVSLRPCKLNEALGVIEKILKKMLTEDILLNMKLCEEELSVAADIGQLDQVIINILANARDAMPAGGVLTITTSRVSFDSENASHSSEALVPGDYACFTISDTGTGMTAAIKEKIFDPFFTTKELSGGTGLGLSIVYGIIKQHGGLITVESEQMLGTTFNIYFPLLESTSPEQELDGTTGNTSSETILLAEDNETLRRMARELLEKNGYSVIEAADGDDAIKKFNDHKDHIDLALIDMVMPGKNGKEVSTHIKNSKPDVKTLFMSGYSRDIIMNKGIYDSGDKLLSKPLSPNELLRSVRELLDK